MNNKEQLIKKWNKIYFAYKNLQEQLNEFYDEIIKPIKQEKSGE